MQKLAPVLQLERKSWVPLVALEQHLKGQVYRFQVFVSCDQLLCNVQLKSVGQMAGRLDSPALKYLERVTLGDVCTEIKRQANEQNLLALIAVERDLRAQQLDARYGDD